ncbi:alpha/beta hydrolase family protein [Rubricoccus marinus]|uniref:Serine aminopeptidase S33 domain-containing protein n=1 Tax=Rubricoccus marinus TaxID=716817 RepID=A0A259U0E9_9BACT|nr:alpha/beta hydrolase [Rubricoccus marinus]OZC03318.1 hypothetical protein BSZ36_10190 [Rubricoccus marinus]
MRRLLIFLLVLCGSAAAQPAAVVGDWSGTVEGTGLTTVFHITETDGVLSTTLDVPAQGAMGVSTGETTFDGTTLTITVPAVNAVYRGTLEGDVITGELVQGQPTTLNLRRVSDGETAGADVAEENVRGEAAVATAPLALDEPKAPFPYQAEEVRVQSVEGVTIAGTLTIPHGAGPFPGVVLVSGSGAQARDSDVAGNKLFYVLSDYLARRGIAVLRYDDRGTAASTGDYGAATTADLALDAQAVAEYLATRSEVESVGIVGHSEGGAIGPIVAVASEAVDFLVLLAGPAIPGREVIQYQLSKDIVGAGLAPEATGAYERGIASMLDALASGDAETAADRAAAAYAAEVDGVDMSALQALGVTSERVGALASGLSDPWMRYYLGYDPALALREVSVPVLALFAARDQQVRVRGNVEAAVDALAGAPEGTEVVVLPNLNHLFQPTQTGAVTEYSTIRQSYAPAVMDRVADWILDLQP